MMLNNIINIVIVRYDRATRMGNSMVCRRWHLSNAFCDY